MQHKIRFLQLLIVWALWGTTVTFESHANCYRNSCQSYRGFMKCLASSASPYAPFVHHPDQLSTQESFQAFQYFMTKHGHCYKNFCNKVCAEYSEERLEKKQSSFFNRFNEQKYEGRKQSIQNFCSQKNESAEQFKFLCSFCTPYLEYGNTLLEECAYERKKPRVTQPQSPTQQATFGRGGYSSDKFDLEQMTQLYDVPDSASSFSTSSDTRPRRKRSRDDASASSSQSDLGYDSGEENPRSSSRNVSRSRSRSSRNSTSSAAPGEDSASSASSFSEIE